MIVLLGFFIGSGLMAADVNGTIVVKQKLTKRAVTASAGSYDRGRTVDLTADPRDRDPLGYERSRVVVYIEGDLPSHPQLAVMEQKNRRFAPDLLAIPVGSTVGFPNGDPIFHNVFSLSKTKMFDLGNYPKGQTRNVAFSKPGIVLVDCHLHSNMAGAIVITPNDFFARVPDDGRFSIRAVPAGKYTVVAWHKAAGFFRKQIDIRDEQPISLEFLIPLDGNGKLMTQASR